MSRLGVNGVLYMCKFIHFFRPYLRAKTPANILHHTTHMTDMDKLPFSKMCGEKQQHFFFAQEAPVFVMHHVRI